MIPNVGKLPIFKVPMGASPLATMDTLKAAILDGGWQLKAENRTVTPYHIDVRPGNAEPQGNADGFAFLRIRFYDTKLDIQPRLFYIRDFKQEYIIMPKASGGGGRNAASVTVDGTTYTQDSGTLFDTNTASENIAYLFQAMKASSLGTQFDIELSKASPNPANNQWGANHIYLRRKTAGTSTITAGAYVDAYKLRDYRAGNQDATETYTGSCLTQTYDLVWGWVCYLQTTPRTLVFGAKTPYGIQPTLWASWANRADALAAMPKGRDLTPIELIVGQMDGSNLLSAEAYASHWWAFSDAGGTAAIGDNGKLRHPAALGIRRFEWSDVMPDASNNAKDCKALPAGVFTDANAKTSLDDFQLIPLVLSPFHTEKYAGEYKYTLAQVPGLRLSEVFKAVGVIADEAVLCAGNPDQATTLAEAIEAGATPATLALTDASMLQAAGTVVIDGESFNYTGKSGNTVTGVTRIEARKPKHWPGEPAMQGLWFVKMGAFALFNGFTSPL